MESFEFEQQVLFRVDSLFNLQPHGLVPPGMGKGVIIKNILDFFIPPANCVCGRVYCFHVVRPNERTEVCP